MDIKSISQESFESVLANNKSKILFGFDGATIDCDYCKNSMRKRINNFKIHIVKMIQRKCLIMT